MDTAKTTPKDFFLWAGAMVTLYASVVAFIGLIFDYLNYVFPDTALSSYYNNPYSGGIAYEMAALIVLAPAFLILMRIIRKNIASDASRGEVWVRRWALFLTLFFAGATIVIDLIVLLTTFLIGEELTLRFLLKILVVLFVAAAGFMHFITDIRGYWAKFPERARYVNWATAVLIVLTVVAGFFIVGTPNQARQMRIDQERVGNLSSIQSEIVQYFKLKQKLPATLTDLNDPLSYVTVPLDPTTNIAYEYRLVDAKTFELCATFSLPSTLQSEATRVKINAMDENWQHGAGRTCFTRGPIDPALYPATYPTPKPAPSVIPL
jgi:hypothetical protein